MSTKIIPFKPSPFYPERHLDELDGFLDEPPPEGWTLGQYIRALFDAKLMLWKALNYVDDEGEVRPRWK
jgi:hypothetical protein